MTYASSADFAQARPSVRKPSRFWVAYANPMLWTLQGWLAMFFIAAAYAKLTQPQELLAILLTWTVWTPVAFVKAVGWVELAMGLGVLTPLVSWRWGRPVMMVSAAGLTASALVMTVVHAAAQEPGLAVTNLALVAIGAGLVLGRSREARRLSAQANR